MKVSSCSEHAKESLASVGWFNLVLRRISSSTRRVQLDLRSTLLAPLAIQRTGTNAELTSRLVQVEHLRRREHHHTEQNPQQLLIFAFRHGCLFQELNERALDVLQQLKVVGFLFVVG